eukprot:TRINITY_DN73691_c0_g1_i1.p1 TRINITY_DN73691_c0_g1~~TRINITY_DN73691_c0_g1_i1.p1  ORF type:complete len:655 (+),score=95.85 TRINITY_DN73691_c0_g1_i1:64-1965(+)
MDESVYNGAGEGFEIAAQPNDLDDCFAGLLRKLERAHYAELGTMQRELGNFKHAVFTKGSERRRRHSAGSIPEGKDCRFSAGKHELSSNCDFQMINTSTQFASSELMHLSNDRLGSEGDAAGFLSETQAAGIAEPLVEHLKEEEGEDDIEIQDEEDLNYRSTAPSSVATFQRDSSMLHSISKKAKEAMSVQRTDSYQRKVCLQRNIEWIVSIVILANMIVLGVSIDCYRDWEGWLAIEIFFIILYTIELLIKFYTYPMRHLFCSGEAAWNIFDCVVVFFMYFDIISHTGDMINLTGLRLIRIFRLARLVRLFRAPFFKEILMMVDGMVGSIRTLFWSAVLIAVPFYGLAILLRETLGFEDPDDPADQFKPFFGTVSLSWFTVFRCVMGDCTDLQGRPLILHILDSTDHAWAYALGYTTLRVLSFFGLFNIITAIYVENLVDAAKSNESLVRRRRLNDEKLTVVSLSRLTHACWKAYCHANGMSEESAECPDLDKAAEIEISEPLFQRIMEDRQVNAILDGLDVANADRVGLFEVLDADGSGTLHMDEILNGLMKLRGDARRSDAVVCSLILRDVQKSLRRFFAEFDEVSGPLSERARLTDDELKQASPRLSGAKVFAKSEPQKVPKDTSTFRL